MLSGPELRLMVHLLPPWFIKPLPPQGLLAIHTSPDRPKSHPMPGTFYTSEAVAIKAMLESINDVFRAFRWFRSNG
jgi:hypothetical protein